MMFKRTRYDIKAILERDPAARSAISVFLLYPGFHAVLFHRFSHMLYRAHLYFLARLISQIVRFFTHIEIHPGAQIGKGVFIDHGAGVVIGETAIVGDDCTIYQGVTLGGTGKDKGKRHPTIGRNVMIGTGAKVLGPFSVGDNSKIAANAVVLSEVLPDSTCVGVPARTIKRRDVRVDMDWVHIPDPVSQELCKLHSQLESMQKEIDLLKGENSK